MMNFLDVESPSLAKKDIFNTFLLKNEEKQRVPMHQQVTLDFNRLDSMKNFHQLRLAVCDAGHFH